MSKRTDITDVLMGLLKDQMPDVHWGSLVTGANRTSRLEGTVTCDRITYQEMTKSARKGVMTYSIYLLDTQSIEGVDALADELDALLTQYPDLGGWCTGSRVKEIIFGAAQGRANAGMALISYEVYFDC